MEGAEPTTGKRFKGRNTVYPSNPLVSLGLRAAGLFINQQGRTNRYRTAHTCTILPPPLHTSPFLFFKLRMLSTMVQVTAMFSFTRTHSLHHIHMQGPSLLQTYAHAYSKQIFVCRRTDEIMGLLVTHKCLFKATHLHTLHIHLPPLIAGKGTMLDSPNAFSFPPSANSCTCGTREVSRQVQLPSRSERITNEYLCWQEVSSTAHRGDVGGICHESES